MNFKNHKGRERVVVTGTGVVSPIGLDSNSFWTGLVAGANGAAEITAFDPAESKVKLAAELKAFDPMDYFNRKDVRRMDRSTQVGIIATREAVKMAGLESYDGDPYRAGTILGTGIGGFITIQDELKNYHIKGPRFISPLFIPTFIANMTPGRIAMEFPFYGANYTVTSACASATHAIGEAFQKITNGYLDVCITGGFEAVINESAIAGFANMTALTTETDPELASRPFDRERSGFLMGEGAGILVLESLESAVKRGAHVLAEITGYGATADGYHITSPDPEGKGDGMAITLALQDAGRNPEEVDYVNAHGTSTPLNDKYETIAMKNALGQRAYEIPISSIKGNTGHLLGAAGAVEAIATIKMIEDSLVPRVRGLVNKDEACDLDYVLGENRSHSISLALSNNLGFGGQNAVVCIEKYQEA